jgi:hypothetical protein
MAKTSPPLPQDDSPDQPWTIEADIIATVFDKTEAEAIDIVIWRYLKKGQTSALAWWLYEGYVPSEWVLKGVACMLEPGDVDKNRVPFELLAVSE